MPKLSQEQKYHKNKIAVSHFGKWLLKHQNIVMAFLPLLYVFHSIMFGI